MADLTALEVCAGPGGMASGLARAGFRHLAAVEVDGTAALTLRVNLERIAAAEGRAAPEILVGDVADESVLRLGDFRGVALLAAGVPGPPPFNTRPQSGFRGESDLFAWAVAAAESVRPKAVLLESVPGLAQPGLAGYRQEALEHLAELGYEGDWRVINAADFGLPQRRRRFVLIALQQRYASSFAWPQPIPIVQAVGTALHDLMAQNGWPGAAAWAKRADQVAPTVLASSHASGPAVGSARALQAWLRIGVDALGIADQAPPASAPVELTPRLTNRMVARLQGFEDRWRFEGKKSAVYRQIANAFPPPLAAALGHAIGAVLASTAVEDRANQRLEGLAVNVSNPSVAGVPEIGEFKASIALPAIGSPVGDVPDRGQAEVVTSLRHIDPDGSRTGQVLRDTFDQLYDGWRTRRYRWDQLFKTEKTHFGTLVEINLQREFEFADGVKLDFCIAGYEVDAKYSQTSGGWMLPPEAVGELCLVVTASDQNSRFSLGVVRATEARLNTGVNRDMKRTLSANGRASITWLHRDAPLPPNVLLHLPPDDVAAIFAFKGGTKAVSELFRRTVGRVVGRASVAAAAAQLDPTRRVRGGQGGSRDPLALEGIVVLGGAYDWQAEAARQLALPVPRRTEYVAGYVAPADAGGEGNWAVGPTELTLQRTTRETRAAFNPHWYGRRRNQEVDE